MTDGALRIPLRERTGVLPRLGTLARVLAMFAIAAVAGLGGTWLAVDAGAGFGAVRVGPWTAYPRNGSVDADPYSRAVVARTGVMPLGLGEGLTFTARRDSAGQPLIGACEYQVAGFVPPTRYWTLSAETPSGTLIANPAGRHGFTSGEIVRGPDGSFIVAVAATARAGSVAELQARLAAAEARIEKAGDIAALEQRVVELTHELGRLVVARLPA